MLSTFRVHKAYAKQPVALLKLDWFEAKSMLGSQYATSFMVPHES